MKGDSYNTHMVKFICHFNTHTSKYSDKGNIIKKSVDITHSTNVKTVKFKCMWLRYIYKLFNINKESPKLYVKIVTIR